MLIIELNEFNPELLHKAASELRLAHIRRLLDLRHVRTHAGCTAERHGLDPWVQWVSFHTGVDVETHGIRHLGDIRFLKQPQFWERAATSANLRSGLWGLMNAAAGSSREHLGFFIPDPWTFSEQAYPAELDHFLALPRHYAKNYLDPSPGELVRGAARLGYFLLRPWRLAAVVRELPALLRGLMQGGVRTTTLFGLFDLVNCALFIRYKRRYTPDVSVIFLNAVAHLQHHAWHSRDRLGAETATVMRLLDRALELLFASAEDEDLLVLNAFRQQQCLDEGAILYRQTDPAAFLHAAGIGYTRLEQLMTNDAQLRFASPVLCAEAARLLRGANIAGKAVFDVEIHRADPSQLFFQLDTWEEIPEDALLSIGDREMRFHAWFERVVKRTGRHVPDGDAYCRGIEIPDGTALYAVGQHVMEHLCKTARSSS